MGINKLIIYCFTDKSDIESSYNIFKDIALYNGNVNSNSNRTVIIAKGNK